MMVTAMRADILVFFQIVFVQYRFTARAFDPKALGDAASVGRVGMDNLWAAAVFQAKT